jgi:hypothetical protein
MSVESILSILKSIRIGVVRLESEIVSEVEKRIAEAKISFAREVTVSPGCRVDILAYGGIVIEVKKGKPNARAVAAQIRRYANSDKVNAVILVSERGLVQHLNEANGKPVKYVSLSSNWGMTI